MLCIEIIAYFTLTNRIEHDNRTMYTNHTWKKICILATGCRRLGIKKTAQNVKIEAKLSKLKKKQRNKQRKSLLPDSGCPRF